MTNLGQEVSNVALALFVAGVPLKESLRKFKRAFVEEALRDCGGNQCAAAIKLGWHRSTLILAMNELGIDASRFHCGRGPRHRPPQRAFHFPDAAYRRSA